MATIVKENQAQALAYEQQVLNGLGMTAVMAAPPNNGNVKGLCLIVDFSDEVATIPASEIDDYCNLVGYTGYGNNGSVRDYFFDVSDGNLTYTNFVPVAYYRAQNPKSYYDDCGISAGTRARELVVEALNDLESNGFDFSQYDSNGDGLIDAINCFYAGTRGCGWSSGLWPHSWTVSFSADGVSAFRYQITDIQNSLRLSTFCHENGHMICYWPDLYDYGGESAGVGRFCIMCAYTSGTNPQEPSAYMKHIAGWTTTNLLTTPQSGIAVPSNANTIYKYDHPNLSNEYFLIENRQRTGRDAGLPDAGLAIWHIDTDGSNSNEQMTPGSHYEVTLVQADGDWDLENDANLGDATDLWSDPGYVQLNSFTNPNTDWWSGVRSNMNISQVSNVGTIMTFSYDNAACVVSPTTIDFGLIEMLDSLSGDFWIRNNFDTTLAGDVFESCPHFSIVSGAGPYTLDPGDSLMVTVQFEPTLAGHMNCAVETGNPLCPVVSCIGSAYDPGCTVSPEVLDMGAVEVGTLAVQNFTIENTNSVWMFGSITSCAEFTVFPESYSIGPGNNQVFQVLYAPPAAGADTCVIDTGADNCFDVTVMATAVGGPELTVNVVGGGTVTKTPDLLVYVIGDTVFLEATADTSWVFSGWSGGLTSVENPDTIVMIADTTITATFAPDSFTVIVTTDPPGLSVMVDSVLYSSPRQFVSAYGAMHEIGVDTPQANGDSVHVFSAWSDGGTVTHTIVVPDSSPTYTAGFTTLRAYALIDSIVDVPDDQGRWVNLHFARSWYDSAGEQQYPIAMYNIWRRVDSAAMVAVAGPADPQHVELAPARAEPQHVELPTGTWEVIDSVAAAQLQQYVHAVPTLGDSSDMGVPLTAYAVSAHSTTPTVWFMSPADSGYSVDNIAPAAPGSLMVAYNTGSGNHLTWAASAEPDVQYYRIYRDGDPAFTPEPLYLVHTTVATEWFDPDFDGWDVHYKITVVDDAGNESGDALDSTPTAIPDRVVPGRLALYQNIPNPFNPVTAIHYDVPADGTHLSLQVFDVSGQLVRTLVDGVVSSGQRSVTWDGTDASGSHVSSGIYFYRLQAGDNVITRKMVLLK
jgi:M6 family metalloprotease-like protein